MTVFWIALAISTVAFIAGVAFVVVRGLETKRAVKRLADSLGAELERLNRAGEVSNEKLAAATRSFERLQAKIETLSTARTRLRVINEALSEAEAIVTRARAFIPSK